MSSLDILFPLFVKNGLRIGQKSADFQADNQVPLLSKNFPNFLMTFITYKSPVLKFSSCKEGF